MTVIRPNSISGITSLTAHRGSIDFYAHDGSAATFTNINSNVTSGVSTFASLNITGDLDVGGALTYEDVTNVDSIGVITARAGVDVNNGHIVLDSGYSLQWSDSHERIEQSDGKLEFFTNNTEKVTISGGSLGIGDVSPTYELEVASSDTTTLNITAGGNTNISRLFFSDGDAVARGYLNYNHNDDNLIIGSAGAERLRLTSDGTIHVNSPDSASGGRIYAASSKLYLQSGNGRQSVNIADMASGQSATHEFTSTGNLSLASALLASSVNLQSSSTSSWFQTGANYGGSDYVWAAKDSSTNVWHSGLQTDGDLWLGGNITGTSNIKLNGSNGSATFTGTIQADPFLLNANSSWMKSTYGAISNSTVSSLNNLMIGQNMRGWIGTRDGGSPTNNFYNIITHGGLGYCGTEYCYQGITKFYNNTGATTADATFTPYERVRLTSSRFTSASGFHFSTNSSSNNSLPNPYAIGNVNANSAAYPHTPGIYLVSASSPCDNTWRTLLTSINDSAFVFEGISGDASSKRNYKVIGNPTSPSYGINRLLEDYNHGAWNTGDIEFRLDGTHPNWNLQVKCTSYYNSSNTATIRFMLFAYY